MQVDRKTIRRRRNLLLLLVAIVLFASALAYTMHWALYGRFWVVTDNDFVTGNLIPVYADAQGASLEADLKAARADFQRSQAQVGGTTQTHHPDIEIARSKFIDAYIEFARQQILAPVSGYIAKRKAQVGDRVRPGDQVMTIVPLDHLWVEANLWENRLQWVRPGQPALVTVDLYGQSYTYHGTVEGLVPGTGSVFAL